MFHRLLEELDRVVEFNEAKAHCDIPCGIYDPTPAQIDALTVIRMVDLMQELGAGKSEDKVAFHNSMARYIAVKEEHAEDCKNKIRVIWGDFIKPDHVKKYPKIHDLVHKIMQLGSKSRQTADRETALGLLEAVNEFAEIFWEIKGVKTKKAKAPYAPGEEVVYPDL